MRGLLIVNHFFNNAKFGEIYDWLRVAAKKQDVALEQYTNAELIGALLKSPDFLTAETTRADFVLFWDKDIRLARLIESFGVRVFNCADAIELCDDKARTYIALKNHGIRMPKTVLVPMTYFPVNWAKSEFVDEVCAYFDFPVVLKECFGSFGEQVFLVNTRDELARAMNAVDGRPVIIQEFIGSSAGRDLRLNVVGGEVAACMLRRASGGGFRANITGGALMELYRPTYEQIEMATRVCDILGLDFGGVDLLFDSDGSPILCEVNSNAHFKNIYDCTGVNVADRIICHIRITVDGK